MVAHVSASSRKHKVELDSHADTCVVCENCLVTHYHNRPVYVYSYDPIDGHRIAKTVDVSVGYQDPQSGQKLIIIINQAIHIDGLVNHLLCLMKCYLNGVHIRKVPKFLAESASETTHAIKFGNPFHTTTPINHSASVEESDQLF